MSHDANVRFCRGANRAGAANTAKPWTIVRMARGVLPLFMMRVLTVTLPVAVVGAGCVIPPPLQLDEPDAGVNATPVIVSAGPAPDFSFPGPIVVEHSDTRRVTLTISDTDLNDTMYVRIYRNYGDPDPSNFVSSCTIPPSGEKTRSGECSASSFCNGLEPTDQGDKTLEAMVADRAFLEESDPAGEGQPAFRRLPAGAQSSIRAWVMTCQAPTN